MGKGDFLCTIIRLLLIYGSIKVFLPSGVFTNIKCLSSFSTIVDEYL